MSTLFHILFFSFITLSILFIILGLSAIDFGLLSIAVLFAVCAVLVGLENKQQLQNPFSN